MRIKDVRPDARAWTIHSPRTLPARSFVFLIVSNCERWRVGGFFWNKMGLEFTLMWTVASLYFLVHGGVISVDHLLIGREF